LGGLVGFRPVEPKQIDHESGQTCCNGMRKPDADWTLAGRLAFGTKIPLFLPLCNRVNTTCGTRHVLDFPQTAPSIAIVILFLKENKYLFSIKIILFDICVNRTFHVE
jgi:hypothetical protein